MPARGRHDRRRRRGPGGSTRSCARRACTTGCCGCGPRPRWPGWPGSGSASSSPPASPAPRGRRPSWSSPGSTRRSPSSRWSWPAPTGCATTTGPCAGRRAPTSSAATPGYRYLRAKGNSIEGGTSEILRNIIAERVLGLPPGDPGGQGRAMEGPAAMSQATETASPRTRRLRRGPAAAPDLLYTEHGDRAARRRPRAAGGPGRLARRAGQDRDRRDLRHRAVADAGRRRSGCAGPAGARGRTAAPAPPTARPPSWPRSWAGHVAPVPFLGSAVIATTALLSAGDDELLAELASGAVTAALAVPFAAGAAGAQGTCCPRRPCGWAGPARGDEPGTYRLTGTVTGVADALPGRRAAGPGRRRARTGCTRCGPPTPGVSKAPVVSLDMTRQLCDLTLDGRVGAAGRGRRRRGRAGRAAGAGRRGRDPRLRAARPGRAVPGDDRRLRQGAAPVRPAGRLVPGAQAPAGRPVGGRDPGPRGGPVRGRLPGRRRSGHRAGRRAGQGHLLGGGGQGRPGDHPAARRHRLHLGAPGAPVPEAGQGRLASPSAPPTRTGPPWPSWPTCPAPTS